MAAQDRQAAGQEIDRKGMWMGFGAYAAWIAFPVYFKLLGAVPPLEILVNRVVWSLVFMVIVVTWKRRWGGLRVALPQRRVLVTYSIAALLLAVNWYIYIWAVNNGHILEGSLGYFINPLVSVLLGVVFFRERLRIGQWGAIALAAVGVGYLTWNYGHLPWIALSLALTFGIYGMVKKLAPLPAEEGLTLETAVLLLPALAALIWFETQRTMPWPGGEVRTDLLLMLSGPVTAVPLLMFAAAARLIPLSVLGVLQYIAPTGQFIIGVWLYNEPFPAYKLVGFAIIWGALALYWMEGRLARRAPLSPASQFS